MMHGFVLTALLAFLLQAPAPEGFRSFESKTKGIAMHIPGLFEELPVPPDEIYIQLKFTEKELDPKDKRFRPEIWVLCVEKAGVETGAPDEFEPEEGDKPEKGGEKKEGEKEGEKEEKKEEKKEDKKEKPAAPPKKYGSFESYVKGRFRGWRLKSDGTLDAGKDRQFDRYKLLPQGGAFQGVAYVFHGSGKDWIVIGLGLSQNFADYQKTFERCAKSFHLTQVREALTSDIDAFYRVNPFRNIEYRKEVRRNLAKGWKAADTNNYILIYDTKDEHLISKIKNDLEAVRTKYVEMFPPAKEIEAVSTVRVCKDKDEFSKFSGMPPMVAGFWNDKSQELVFYDANADPTPHGQGRKDSYIVLYHEAFHQYIFYSCGEVAPHSWFNEGYGDYFSGSVIGLGGKKVDRLEVNSWRAGLAKRIVAEEKFTPLKEIVTFEQPQYYKPDRIGLNYAQGWSIIYFLNESKVVKKHPVWSKILTTYFETLKSKYTQELQALGENPKDEKKDEAKLKARKAALRAAFKDVNFEELEKAWIEFVSKIVDPRAQ